MQHIIILDANAILRYIIDDIPEQADIVEEILRNEKILILPEVLAEVIYVMSNYYKQPRDIVSKRIIDFLDDVGCNSERLRNAVSDFGSEIFDFVDCLLFGYSKQEPYKIFTFDKKLKKRIDTI